MLTEIECFVNWVRRGNPQARTWRDYYGDLKQLVAVVGDQPPESATFHDIDRLVGDFERVLMLYRKLGKGRSIPKMAFYTGLREGLVKQYVSIIKDHRQFLEEENAGEQAS